MATTTAAPHHDAKTVCVTGTGGYIGSWIVKKLLAKGYKVRGVDRNPDDEARVAHFEELEGASERLTVFEADVCDYEAVSAAIRGCDGVFHTACPVYFCIKKADDVLVPAVRGTENVMKACHEHGVKRVVMTSCNVAMLHDPKRASDKVIDESCWSNADYCLEHKDYYSAAKTKAEELAWKMAKAHNIDLVVICPAMVLGPLLQYSLNTSLLHLQRLVDGTQSGAICMEVVYFDLLLGAGSEQTYPNKYVDVVDVRDTAEAHLLAYETPEASGRYYCVSQVVTYKDIVEVLKKHFPYFDQDQFPEPESCEGETPAGIPPAKVSNTKIKTLIKEFIPFETMLVDGMQSLREREIVLM